MGMMDPTEPKQGLGMLDLQSAAPFAVETLIVSDTVAGLTSAIYNPSGAGGSAQRAIITHEGANIRWWAAKSDAQVVATPTTVNGHLHRETDLPNALFLQSSSEVRNFRVMRVETTGISTIQVEYYH